MKHLVDEALCAGHGLCAAVAPAVYDLDDDGLNAAIGTMVAVAPGQEGAAREGAAACPEQAIRLTD
ncbi:ferredoxin [Pseudonocardia sp. RS010]|uniref:ferredoxin n=1 Tax=Pseudonocardia sp. RS010 TaxID=3385979 RepID=UPI0039A38D1B